MPNKGGCHSRGNGIYLRNGRCREVPATATPSQHVGENKRREEMRKKALYLYVTADEYELPLAVADSIRELAEMTGKPIVTVASSFSRLKDNPQRRKESIYKKVRIY